MYYSIIFFLFATTLVSKFDVEQERVNTGLSCGAFQRSVNKPRAGERKGESLIKLLPATRRRFGVIFRSPKSKYSLVFIHCLLATQISDIEPNPGPSVRYPCGTCNAEVTWDDRSILCDSCDTWFHANCQGMGDNTYDQLPDTSFSWHCTHCGSMNYSSSISESLDTINTSSRFEPLNSAADDELKTPEKTQNSFRNKPNATSTPKPHSQSKHPNKLEASKRITVININCRSVKNKIPDLHQVIQQTKPDVICCTETWLKPEINTPEIFPSNLGYQVYRDDRISAPGGGVLLAISNKILSQEQPDLKSDCNGVWAKISIKGIKDIYISSFYKPHEDDALSLHELWRSVSKIPKNAYVWILGDFNMPDIDWPTQSYVTNCRFKLIYESFLENIVNYNLEQMVKIPTRGKNILDLFLTNIPSMVHNIQTLPSLGSSDHDIVFHELKINRGRPIQAKRTIRSYKKADWTGFRAELNDFAELFIKEDNPDPNDSWNKFKMEMSRLTDKYIPSRQSKTRADLPWISHDIIKLIRKRDKLFSKIKKSHGDTLQMENKLKQLKTDIQKKIRVSYWSYLDAVILGDGENNKKKFYSFIKHQKTENFGIAPLSSNGQVHSDPTTKANILNQQFESVFSRPSPLSLKQLAKSAVPKSSNNHMPPITITQKGVNNLLKGLNPNKASGPDEISPRLLKELHNEVTPILTQIFQKSLETGIVPADWRHAVISPVYKKGKKSQACNYRPISLTCIASKLFEHILVSNIMSYFDSQNILSPQQHGFRSKHSCETQLIGFTQEISDNMENGQQTDVIIMDFSKAFDKVDHHKLIHKLKHMGIDNKVTNWIQSFLRNRSQQVQVEGKQSEKLPVLSGVPQGSVLGPCLFLAYINDLPDSIRSRARLFADDTIVYLSIKSHSSPQQLQKDLKMLEEWEKEWSMEFNPDKCEVLRIHRKKNPIIHPYTLHNTQLKSAEHSKYLGINISNKLDWNHHIDKMTAKANNSLRFIKRNIKTSRRGVKESAYKTYVRPQLEYCSTVWHPWQKHLTNKIEQVQRSAARYVLNDYNYTSSVTEMLNILGWSTLENRRNRTTLIMLYKIIHSNVIVDHNHLQPTRNNNYLIPYSRTQYHLNSFFPRAIRLWNRLPSIVQQSPSLPVYIGRLEHLN